MSKDDIIHRYFVLSQNGASVNSYVFEYKPSELSKTSGHSYFSLGTFTGDFKITNLNNEVIYEAALSEGLNTNRSGRVLGCTTYTEQICVSIPSYPEIGTSCYWETWTICNGGGGAGGGPENPESGNGGDPGPGYKGPTTIPPGEGGGPTTTFEEIRAQMEASLAQEQNPDKARLKLLEYLELFGGAEGKEFVKMYKELWNTPGLDYQDKLLLNKLAYDFKQQLVAQYFAEIFSPDNVGIILSFGLTPTASGTLREAYFKVIPRYFSSGSLGKGYSSFTAFKNAHGAAGTGNNWHHIVSQRSSNEYLKGDPSKKGLEICAFRGASYESYIKLIEVVNSVYLTLRDETCQQKFGRPFGDVPTAQRDDVEKLIPKNLIFNDCKVDSNKTAGGH